MYHREDDHTHAAQESASRSDSYRSFERDVLPLTADIRRVALRYTNNRHDAEDLVQETLLKAFKAFDGLAENSYYRAWLLTIMRYTWISDYRAAARRPSESLVANVADHESTIPARSARDDSASAEHQVLRHLMDDDVREAVLALSAEMRETVYLVAIEGMKHREAAEVMGISPSTVMSRMHRIRHVMRQRLADI
ncbi:sigma-70 family RNA polymerase sigma factor [Mycobacterium sp. AZCC_0083]|uniref:sigma-70 family RNA polymerase sigma factor n=1 Tax=Mycobacterium sp. AZCC_0083 TaxID=2735882 RepID=UPI00161A6A79|nr:sigma-70 family RNA polymerase sigma factor [Mycobacterium sp. AZCC_0083]MBB5167544.1 RNA polymerase sigma-70 factor (ECF subfamily) [Mycobacterium sp. AZCC_0083]